MTNRATLYLRSSKDRSDVSIDAQRRALHDLAVTRGLVVVDEFADAVESGKDEDRPAFQRLLHQLKSPTREWDAVMCLDTSRVARRREIALFFERECKRQNVKVIYRNVPDTEPITEMLLKSILQAMDEWHSLTSRQKGLAGMAENVRQGWRAGGKAPRGYQLEYIHTGAMRDGQPVLKSRLVVDEECAGIVRGYLLLRAQGIPRGVAIARLQLPWPTSSTHSMDWQAMTYAGHTVWNMHSERTAGTSADGMKRRPRSEWIIKRDTHAALISDTDAEQILKQQELAVQGRRLRESPLLLTGLLVCPNGGPWHSDGAGRYRLGKGVRVSAERLERAVLDLLGSELSSDAAVKRIQEAIDKLAAGPEVDGRKITGLEKRITTLTTQIGRTVDLAAGLADPAPVLRRVSDLEHQRTQLVAELAKLREQKEVRSNAEAIHPDTIRALLRRLVEDILESAGDEDRRSTARQAINEVVEKIELDPSSLTWVMHFAVRSGDNLASPTGTELSPTSWQSEQQPTLRRRA